MSVIVEMTDGIPLPANNADEADDVLLYGTDLKNKAPNNNPAVGEQRVLAYGFCYQGHCYRLSMPVEIAFGRAAGPNNNPPATPAPEASARGCGYETMPDDFYYRMWRVEKTEVVRRIERRKGSLEELLLDFNLPGRSPATLTYSAKVGIAAKAGKVYE